MAKKRERSENWLGDDRNLLTELVRERVSIIENKKTDTETNTKKQAAWEDLFNIFNIMCKGSIRTIAQLKSQWGIIKYQKRKSKDRWDITTSGDPLSQQDPENGHDINARISNKFVIDTNVLESVQMNRDTPGEIPPSNLIIEIDEDDGEQEITTPATDEFRRASSRKKAKENKTTTSAASAIARAEIECRRELHNIQMENERKKSRNLDLEEVLIKRKIEYYENKNKIL